MPLTITESATRLAPTVPIIAGPISATQSGPSSKRARTPESPRTVTANASGVVKRLELRERPL